MIWIILWCPVCALRQLWDSVQFTDIARGSGTHTDDVHFLIRGTDTDVPASRKKDSFLRGAGARASMVHFYMEGVLVKKSADQPSPKSPRPGLPLPGPPKWPTNRSKTVPRTHFFFSFVQIAVWLLTAIWTNEKKKCVINVAFPEGGQSVKLNQFRGDGKECPRKRLAIQFKWINTYY